MIVGVELAGDVGIQRREIETIGGDAKVGLERNRRGGAGNVEAAACLLRVPADIECDRLREIVRNVLQMDVERRDLKSARRGVLSSSTRADGIFQRDRGDLIFPRRTRRLLGCAAGFCRFMRRSFAVRPRGAAFLRRGWRGTSNQRCETQFAAASAPRRTG